MSSLPPILLAALLLAPDPGSAEESPDLFPTELEPAPPPPDPWLLDDPGSVATTGIEMWAASCPWATETGGCFEWRGESRPPLRGDLRPVCGDRRPSPEVHSRDPAAATTAIKLLGIATYRFTPEYLEARPDLRERAAAVAFTLGEVELEKTLSLEPGFTLAFQVDRWRRDSGVRAWELLYEAQVEVAETSRRAFDRHVRRLAVARERTERAYLSTIEHGVPHWTLAALARLAQLQEVVPELRVGRSFHPPVAPADDPPHACHDGRPREDPLAVERYETCVDASRALQHANEYSEVCWAALARLEPLRFPPLLEAWSPALVSSSTLVHEPARDAPSQD